MHSLAEDVFFESKLLLFLQTTCSSYSLSVKASSSLTLEMTEMLMRSVLSLAAICASSTVSFSRVMNRAAPLH